MTIEELIAITPKNRHKYINQEMVDKINLAEKNGDFEGELEKDIISFSNVLKDGRYKLTDYFKAVEFCAHYLNGSSQVDAYLKTFPEIAKRRILEGKTSYATGAPPMYFKGDLVQKILAQAQIPVRLFHHHKQHEAINTLFDLMTSPKATDRIKMESADKLLAHLKEPEAQKIELDIGVKEDESVQDLQMAMKELARQQRELIEGGHLTAKQIANQQIVGTSKFDSDIIEAEIDQSEG